MRGAGHLEEAARRMACPQAGSTKRIYDSRWSIFGEWCDTWELDPFEATVPQVAAFLLFLFHELERSMQTIKGFRTAIASGLIGAGKEDIGKNRELSRLITSLTRERPVTRNPVPGWNLSFVLWSLLAEPFEPMGTIPLKLLTWKTVFLLLLAAGCRRGELHAVEHSTVKHTDGWSMVHLQPGPQFVHKTQVRGSVVRKPKRISIPHLKPLLGQDLDLERTLCPNRALKYYLARTEQLRKPGQKLLFISFDKERHQNKEVHKNTISSWVRKCIQFCYQNAKDNPAELVGARAHDLRGMAATLAWDGCTDIEDILQAGSWTTANTFISHYVKDGVMDSEGFSRVGPIVAAQRVLEG